MTKKERVFIQIQIDPTKKGKFTNKVEEEGKSITDVITSWINGYIDESEKVDVFDLKNRLDNFESGDGQVISRIEALEKNVLQENSTFGEVIRRLKDENLSLKQTYQQVIKILDKHKPIDDETN